MSTRIAERPCKTESRNATLEVLAKSALDVCGNRVIVRACLSLASQEGLQVLLDRFVEQGLLWPSWIVDPSSRGIELRYVACLAHAVAACGQLACQSRTEQLIATITPADATNCAFSDFIGTVVGLTS